MDINKSKSDMSLYSIKNNELFGSCRGTIAGSSEEEKGEIFFIFFAGLYKDAETYQDDDNFDIIII